MLYIATGGISFFTKTQSSSSIVVDIINSFGTTGNKYFPFILQKCNRMLGTNFIILTMEFNF